MNTATATLSRTASASLPELLARLRRRTQPMAIAFGAVVVLSIALAIFWPPTYRTSGTILIEQQEVPAEMIRSTISSYADQRIQVIQQQVMTTENLLRIIQKYDLYARKRRYQSREQIVRRMVDDVQFKMISADVIDPRTGSPTKATIAFSVGFDSHDPTLATRVANELVSLYLEQNLVSRKQHTDDAADFLSGESERLSKRIDELQGKIAEFKQQHAGELPDDSLLNQTQLSRAGDELRDIDTRARALDQQLVYLDGQLAQLSPSSQVYTSTGERVLSPADRLKFVRTEYARLSGIYGPNHPDVLRTRREMDSLEQAVGQPADSNDVQRQLKDAQTKLAAARQKYSEEYPDVKRLERLVASLGQAPAAANTTATTAASATQPATAPDNPAYIQIKAQREASAGERASLATARAQLQAKIADYEKRLASAPAVERDYAVMARELDNDQIQYRDVRQKQLEADSSRNLEVERKGERMTLIEPPIMPTEPVSPNRAVILALGLIGALGAAVGAAALLDSLDGSVRGARDLTALLAVPPLAVLPWIETTEDRVARQRQRRIALAVIAGVIVLLLACVHFFYRPLDVLWEVAVRRMLG